MKKLIALFMSVIMILGMCGSVALAADTELIDTTENNAYNEIGTNAVTLNIGYSQDSNGIEISGNVNYNLLVNYGKYRLGILRIAPEQNTEDALEADSPNIVAEMNIAAKFAFSVEIKNNVERFSKYAVVLISPENEIILASAPKYVRVASGYSKPSATKDNFKGFAPIGMADMSLSGDMGFGSAVIPVDMGKLVNPSMNGYIYPYGDTHCFFDKTYIDELDSKIRTYSSRGARVYLQLLLPKDSQTANLHGTVEPLSENYEYIMPDVYDENTISSIYTYVKFLSSRYNNYVDGRIGGIIVGKQIDVDSYNVCGTMTDTSYAQKYAFYLAVVANTARIENPNIDIVIPLSATDSYGKSVTVSNGDRIPSLLVEEISKALDSFFDSAFDCSIMLESNSLPLEAITLADGSGEIFTQNSEENYELDISELSRFESYLTKIKKSYKSAPKSYIYFWNIPSCLRGTLLECSYTYSYYGLIKYSNAASFVISLHDSDITSLDSIKKTVCCIDTKDGITEAQKLLQYFGAESWNELISGFTDRGLSIRNEYVSKGNAQSFTPKGSFSFFDFSTGDMIGWYGASYSKGVKADYDEQGQRVLRQTVGRANGSAHSDLLCLLEYDESLKYTPSLCFRMSITDGEVSSGSIYEVTVTVGKDNGSISESKTVTAGDSFDIWLDVSEYSKANKMQYIKISTRSITGDADEYSLWVCDVSGHNEKYSSEELSALISAERQNIREQLKNNGGATTDTVIYWIVFSIILFAIFIGGILVIVLRREDTKKRKK